MSICQSPTRSSDHFSVAQVIRRATKTNESNSINDLGLVKKGEMTPAVNHAAATVFAKSESAFL